MSSNNRNRAYSIMVPLVLFWFGEVFLHYVFSRLILFLECRLTTFESITSSNTRSYSVSDSFDTVADVYGRCDFDRSKINSARSGMVILVSSLAFDISGFLTVGLYGSLADKYGRKFPLCSSTAGIGIMLLSMLVASHSYFLQSYHIIIVIGSFLYGLCGTKSTFIMAAFSYASDYREDTDVDCTVTFRVLEATKDISKIVAPLLIGHFTGRMSAPTAVAYSLLFPITCFLWIFFLLPESLSVDAPSRQSPLTVDPFVTFYDMGKLYGLPYQLGNEAFPLIVSAFCLHHICSVGDGTIEILFQRNTLLMSPDEIGLFGSVRATILVASMMWVPRLIHTMKQDIHWIELGLWCRVVYYALYGISNNATQLFGVLPILLFTGLVSPCTRALLSKCVSHSGQAELFAALAALESITVFAAPFVGLLYSRTVSFFPGYSFEALAVLHVLCAGMIAFVRLTIWPTVVQTRRDYRELSGMEETLSSSSFVVSTAEDVLDQSVVVVNSSVTREHDHALPLVDTHKNLFSSPCKSYTDHNMADLQISSKNYDDEHMRVT